MAGHVDIRTHASFVVHEYDQHGNYSCNRGYFHSRDSAALMVEALDRQEDASSCPTGCVWKVSEFNPETNS